MGYIIDIDARVSVELRRESFILVAGTDTDNVAAEYDYRDLPAIVNGIAEVMSSERYAKWKDLKGIP